MKVLGEENRICVIKNQLNVTEEIQKHSNDDIQDESLYIADLTDIIKKHLTWRKLMPRVKPFYGKKLQ